jgi:hypothetical protein
MSEASAYDSIAATLGEHLKRSAEALGRIPRDVRNWYSDLPASTGDYMSAIRLGLPGGATRENWEAAKGAYAPALAAAADISNATSGMTGAPSLSASEAAMTTLPARLAYANAANAVGAQRNIFIGPTGVENLFKAGRPAAKEALDIAERLKAQGADRDAIWQATAAHLKDRDPELAGVHYGPEGTPRVEVSDAGKTWKGAKPETLPKYGVDLSTPEESWPHPTLYQAYPDLGDRGLVVANPNPRPAGLPIASYDPRSKSFAVNLTPQYATESPMAHEAQHYAQGAEGTLGGGNWREYITPQSEVLGILNSSGKVSESVAQDILHHAQDTMGFKGKTISDLQRFAKDSDMSLEDIASNISSGLARSKYKRLYGEAEARNVQSRLNMSPEERRATPPWQTLDVPEPQLITKY